MPKLTGTRCRVASAEVKGRGIFSARSDDALGPPLVDRPSIDLPRFLLARGHKPAVQVSLRHESAHCEGVGVTSLQAKVCWEPSPRA